MTRTDDDLSFLGRSAAARQVEHEIAVAAGSDAKVLVSGETGVGKDVVARAIHRRSARRQGPLSVINCAGLTDTLLESELFGHVRGSFTGAVRDKAGLLEAADRGTAFLDEAGEMSLRMQGVLLRFLETGEVQRVGSERAARRVNVRVVAATNRDLEAQVASGAFREDLFYRLNVIRIHVPPLRARREDIPVLFSHFVETFREQYGLAPRVLTEPAELRLMAYHWPGNIRELKNVVERLMVKAPGEPVRAEDVPPGCRAGHGPGPVSIGDGHLERRADVAGPSFGAAARVVDPEAAVARLIASLLEDGGSFWEVVHAPFMSRDLSRDQLRAVVRAGLEMTSGNYRILVQLFNMAPGDYKRFLGFLRKHDCQVPFHPFRGLRPKPARVMPLVPEDYRVAAGM
ncbi:MAG: sigma-54 dependent transcriptional regulator [Acidobacteriota bacterium]|nr:sigma-54 dependent transcriptional regulator [Acidobacteriota bacterium]